jgi:hypothetical protein
MATMEEMATAGVEAENELRVKMADPEFLAAAKLIGGWINKWYLKAGYKRLCRALLAALK